MDSTAFKKAERQVRYIANTPDNYEYAYLYSLFKQATEGNCERKVPATDGELGEAKFQAWRARKGMSKSVAAADYIFLAGKSVRKYGTKDKEAFYKAEQAVRNLGDTIPNHYFANLYSLFKQGTEGDCDRRGPATDDELGEAKFLAWSALKGMDSAVARAVYIKRVEEAVKIYGGKGMKAFKAAEEQVRNLARSPPEDKYVSMYSLFKQATVGDCNRTSPAMEGRLGVAQFKAWQSKKGMSRADAGKAYIAEAAVAVKKYGVRDMTEFLHAKQQMCNLASVPSNEDRAELYAHFKQATVGDSKDLTGPDASEFDLAKSKEWRSLRGMGKADAMERYIALADEIVQEYGLKGDEAFKRAQQQARSLANTPPNYEYAKLHSLYKQATVGDCDIPSPSRGGALREAMYYAWLSKRGMSKAAAEIAYIAAAEKAASKYGVKYM